MQLPRRDLILIWPLAALWGAVLLMANPAVDPYDCSLSSSDLRELSFLVGAPVHLGLAIWCVGRARKRRSEGVAASFLILAAALVWSPLAYGYALIFRPFGSYISDDEVRRTAIGAVAPAILAAVVACIALARAPKSGREQAGGGFVVLLLWCLILWATGASAFLASEMHESDRKQLALRLAIPLLAAIAAGCAYLSRQPHVFGANRALRILAVTFAWPALICSYVVLLAPFRSYLESEEALQIAGLAFLPALMGLGGVYMALPLPPARGSLMRRSTARSTPGWFGATTLFVKLFIRRTHAVPRLGKGDSAIAATTATATAEFRYWALLVHCHEDRGWAAWLARRLAGFSTPARLVGGPSRDGRVPRRIAPILLATVEADREELFPGEEDALRSSRYLVVLCSRAAAVSGFVNRHVIRFKQLGRDDHLMCLIVDGEPNATDKGAPAQECFCPALRHRVDGDAITQESAEPIAPDLRRTPGSARFAYFRRRTAILRVAAGLVGVGFGDLRRRVLRRRLLRVALAAVILALAATAMLAPGYLQQRRDRLRDRLAGVDRALELGRRALVDRDYRRALPLLREVYELRPSTASRFLLASALDNSLPPCTLASPAGRIIDAAFVPDSTLIAMLTDGGTLEWWDTRYCALDSTAQSRGATRILAHTGSVTVVGSDRQAALCWNRKRCESLEVPLGTIKFARLSEQWASGDRTLLIASDLDAVRFDFWRPPERYGFTSINEIIVDAQLGEHAKLLVENQSSKELALVYLREPERVDDITSGVKLARISPSGALLVIIEYDGSVWIYDGSSGKRLRKLDTANIREPLQTILFNADESIILGAHAGGLTKWNRKTGEVADTLETRETEWLSIAFSAAPSGAIVVAAGRDRGAFSWRYGSETEAIGRLGTRATAVTPSPDGGYLLTLDGDGIARLWPASDDPPTARALEGGGMQLPVFDPSGTEVVAALKNGRVAIWDARSGTRVDELRFPLPAIAVGFVRDELRVLIASEADEVAKIVDRYGEEVASMDRTWVEHAIRGFSQLTDTSRYLAMQTDDGALVFRNVLDKDDTRLPMNGRKAYRIAYDRNARRVLVQPKEGSALMWDLDRNADEPYDIGTALSYAAFSTSGDRLIISPDHGAPSVLDTHTHQTLFRLPMEDGSVTDAGFSPDGHLLIAESDRGGLKVWNLPDGSLRSRLEEVSSVSSAAFSVGNLLLAGDEGSNTKIWDTDTGTLLANLEGGDSIRFSPNELLLLNGGNHIYPLRLEQRDPTAIATILLCHVPLQLQGRELVPLATDHRACVAMSSQADPDFP